ncbi:hypothetical protein LCGC14_0706300 [marine sediment metagenome]|uniref:Uncharacterized protein n=2 Tax=root TaxID=1 RepID=A0A0F9TNZ2_9ZZZZ
MAGIRILYDQGVVVMKKVFICLAMLTFVSAQAKSENSIVNLAKKNGFHTCLPQLKISSEFIINDKVHSTHSFWNQEDPDNSTYSSLSVKDYSDGDSHVIVAAAQTSSGKCDTFYVETFVLTKSCTVAREETFTNLKYAGQLNQNTLLLQNDSKSVNVYLTPQNDSLCLVSKKESLYQN